MATRDQNRIENDRAQPRIAQLWWALRPLTSVVRFMQTGAHPDDEISGMLAALAFRDGINISYACSTRGEGGQNEIGPELYEELGVIRTHEMQGAADVEGAELHFLNLPEVGYSKTPEETFEKWGHEVALERMVRLIRELRPDVIITNHGTMKDHGHHQAIGQIVVEAFDAAAVGDRIGF